jgi:hypothetical protein
MLMASMPLGPISGDPSILFGADLKHLWDDYDDGTEIWTDSVGGADGTPDTNAPAEATVNGHSYPVFDGIDTGMYAANTITALDNAVTFTIFGAFKTNNGDTYGGLMGRPGCYYVEVMDPEGTFYSGPNNFGEELIGVSDLQDDLWHRFIVTVTAGAASLYIDAVLEASDTFTAVDAGVDPFTLGMAANETVTDSSIAIMGIATRGMSAPEIVALDEYLAAYVI